MRRRPPGHKHVSALEMRLFLELRLSLPESKGLLRKLAAGCPICLRIANKVLDQTGPLGIETEALGTPWELDD